jgi:hypothetical protein
MSDDGHGAASIIHFNSGEHQLVQESVAEILAAMKSARGGYIEVTTDLGVALVNAANVTHAIPEVRSTAPAAAPEQGPSRTMRLR